MSNAKSTSPRTLWMMVLAAALLLVLGGVGVVQATQAQLVFYSEDYVAEFAQTHIGVALTENDVIVEGDDALLQDAGALLGGDAQMIPGKAYPERLSAVNTTDMGEYVRLTVRKFWADADGQKNPLLDPALIQLGYDDEHWVLNPAECTDERLVFYYRHLLDGDEAAAGPAVTTIAIDPAVATAPGDFTDCRVALAAQVDSVQVNYADDAAGSAWGVDMEALGLDWSEGVAR